MTNRKRGRPVGTHIRDDRPLAMVADRMAANPELKPSTAMRQVYAAGTWRGTEKTVVTRWLRKWKADCTVAMEAAQHRRTARDRAVSLPSLAVHWQHPLEISDELRSAMIGLAQIQEPVRRAMAEMAKSLEPTRAMIELAKGLAPSQAMTELAKSLAPTQAMTELVKSFAPSREFVEQMRELQTQIAAAAGSLKILEIKEAIKNTPTMQISDAIASAVKIRIH